MNLKTSINKLKVPKIQANFILVHNNSFFKTAALGPEY